MRRAFVWLALTQLCACDCGSAIECTSTAACPTGQTCVKQHCVGGTGGGGGDAGATGGGAGGGAGGGGGGGACTTTCGSGCCTAAETCELGACHLKCSTGTTRCGDVPTEACCSGTDVCFLGACTVPGAACDLSTPCPTGQQCDPSINRCLPKGPAGACEFHPDGGAINPSTLWDYTPATDAYTQVMMTPAVVDVNGDGVPDVLANYFTVTGGYNGDGVMRALSGDDGHVLWTTQDVASDHVHPPASIAVGALDSGGQLLAITVSVTGQLVAFDAKTGTRVWTSHDGAAQAVTCAANWGGPGIADLDGDGVAEVYCGLEVFDKDGLVKWNHGLGGGAIGPLSIAVDLDGDGKLELTDGANAYRFDGSAFGWTGAGAAGLLAAGDFVDATGTPGRDGNPELVVTNGGKITLLDGQTGAVLAGPADLPAWDGTQCIQGGGSPGTGGAPTVADFDGDHLPEVGVAAIRCYSEFKLTGSGASLAWHVVWSNKTQDLSSSVTGSSVFDFNGDGRAEVVYADEVAIHVYDGLTGAEVFNRAHCSGTTYEYPLVVDVNANGRADLVVPENTYAAAGLGCDPSVLPGIHVFHDALDQWVNTRQVWNQHAYHVTNVCDGKDQVCGGPGAAGNTLGRVPLHEPPNWAFTNSSADGGEPLDNYRQNVQGQGLFDAPDLVMKDFTADPANCPTTVLLQARVVNQGALGVLAGLKVAFYLDGMPRTLIGVASTTHPLLPGDSEVVSVTFTPPGGQGPWNVVVVADDDGTGTGSSSECVESNNEAGPFAVSCATIN